MSCCTFFGHRYTPKKIESTLRSTLIDLIENKNVDLFYVGNHGGFDSMVKNTLNILKSYYPHINCITVLAYMPGKKNIFYNNEYFETIFPEGMENTPPKYAIIKRNKWMIDKSDYVVTYVETTVGGAAQFKELAEKREKS